MKNSEVSTQIIVAIKSEFLMLKYQRSSINESLNAPCENSLSIEHCPLNIAKRSFA